MASTDFMIVQIVKRQNIVHDTSHRFKIAPAHLSCLAILWAIGTWRESTKVLGRCDQGVFYFAIGLK